MTGDPKRDAIVVVMQRLHTRDLTAVCLEQGFVHLCLPALAPSHATVVFPRSAKTIVRELASPLWPERQGLDELERQRRILGSYGFAGQYQQQPVPRVGGMFLPEWWQWFDVPPGRFDDVVQSWDLSFKDGNDNDFVVGLVAGRIGAAVYVLARFKAKVSFTETLDAIRRMVALFPATTAVLIEDAANGAAVVNVLRQQLRGIIPVRPEGSKFARAAAVQPRLEARQVFLPRPRDPQGHLRHEYAWVDDFVENCAMYPKGEHDDDVDALSQLLLRPPQPTGMSAGNILRLMTGDDEDTDLDDDVGSAREFRYQGYQFKKF